VKLGTIDLSVDFTNDELDSNAGDDVVPVPKENPPAEETPSTCLGAVLEDPNPKEEILVEVVVDVVVVIDGEEDGLPNENPANILIEEKEKGGKKEIT